jgi:site-specific recombinase XerD
MRPTTHLRALGTQPLDLSRVTESYLLACRANGLSPRTTHWYDQKLRGFVDYLAGRRLPLHADDLTLETLRGFVAHLQGQRISAFTVRGYVQVIKGLYTWLTEEGYLDDNPIVRAKMPKTPRYVVKPLEEGDLRRLLAAIDHRRPQGSRDLAIVLLLVDTGMRLGELAGLSLADGEEALRQGMVKVFGKGSRERYVPVGKAAQNALRRYMHLARPQGEPSALFLAVDGIPLTAEGIRQMIRRVSERAGVRGVHPHKLRHTAAVTFLRCGGDAFALQRILGHSTLTMTRNYVTLTDADIKVAHEKASPADRFWGNGRRR